MLRKVEMEDQPYSRLDTSKFQNVLILLLNKWNTEKPQLSLAHKISIKEVMFKNNIETNTMETIGYRTLQELNTSLPFKNAPSIQFISQSQMTWNLLSMDSHSTLKVVKKIRMETRCASLLIHKINMLQELPVSITPIFLSVSLKPAQIPNNNGFGIPKNKVWNLLVFPEVLFSKDSTKTWLSITGEVFTIKDSTTTFQPRNSKTDSLEMPWMCSEIKLLSLRTSTLTSQIILRVKLGSLTTKVKATVTIMLIDLMMRKFLFKPYYYLSNY